MIKKLLSRYRSSYAQAGQDIWVATEVFNEKQNGVFVDAGAFDGIKYSNTYLLETRYRWEGLCIEANPVVYPRLIKNRKAACTEVVLSDSTGQKKFYLQEMGSSVQKIKKSKPWILQSTPLEALLEKYEMPSKIDYLSMDIEGSEERVLLGFPFHKYLFRCATIERPSIALKKNLQKKCYLCIKEIKGLDSFFIHESFFTEYIKNMFAFFEKSSYRWP